LINFTYQPESNFIISTFYGVVTADELRELIEKLLAVDSKKGAMRGLVFLHENTQENSIAYKDICI